MHLSRKTLLHGCIWDWRRHTEAIPKGPPARSRRLCSTWTTRKKSSLKPSHYYFLPGEEELYEEDPVTYASRFWTSKDPRYLTPWNERKIEHYARLVYADLLYGSEGLELRGWDTERGTYFGAVRAA